MRLGFDLDGVCYNFDEALKLYLIEEHEYLEETLPTGGSSWSLAPAWGITEEQFEAYCDQGVDAGFLFLHGDPYPNSVEIINKLRDLGHTIHFITSREFGTRSAHNTMDWLHKYGFPYDSMHFVHDKWMVDVDVLVDDYERNWRECTERGQRVLLMDRPWNRHIDGAERVTWDTMIETVESIA